MQGEFRGDFTRDTANPDKSFLRVLMQQGRVQLDADWNEQTDILLRYVQALGQDLIGFHGGRDLGFKIQKSSNGAKDFAIAPGRYYVDGILCELFEKGNEEEWSYTKQPYYIPPDEKSLDKLDTNGPLLVYLDVWERHISFVEDHNPNIPGIREVALGGPDTATRSQLVWQVKVLQAVRMDDFLEGLQKKFPERIDEDKGDPFPFESVQSRDDDLDKQIRYLSREGFFYYLQAAGLDLLPGQGTLQAKVSETNESNPCRLSPKSKYRGLENRLYRVEIFHHDSKEAYFVWSKHNSSIEFPILSAESSDVVTLSLEHLGTDARYTLTEGDWVELVCDRRVLQHEPRILLKVQEVDTYKRRVKLIKMTAMPEFSIEFSIDDFNEPQQHPYLRRWDSPGAILVESSKGLPLEDGIEVHFPDVSQDIQPYRTGDYWLIPARTESGMIEWPKQPSDQNSEPLALLPKGITHYYAPLAILNGKDEMTIGDCRRQLKNLW